MGSIKMAHLQLTLRCNLRCPFCGQWGESGYVKKHGPGLEMEPGEWRGIVDQVVALGEPGAKPDFILWGGEPLLYEGFDEILERIRFHGCRAALVTNGSLLAAKAESLDGKLSALYLSLDGPGAEHDRIRGSEGLHLKIEKGMAKLAKSSVKKVCLATVSGFNWDSMPETARYAQSLGADLMIFGSLICNLPEDAKAYSRWLKESFAIDSDPSAWTVKEVPEFAAKLPAACKEMENLIERGEFKMKVEFSPKGLRSSNALARFEGRLDALPGSPAHCLAPERHVNVSPDGSVRFCVDYGEFSLGSLKDLPLAELLASEKAARFSKDIAAGRNPCCKRCPWRHQKNYEID